MDEVNVSLRDEAGNQVEARTIMRERLDDGVNSHMRSTLEPNAAVPVALIQPNIKSNSLPYKHKLSAPQIPSNRIKGDVSVTPITQFPPQFGQQRASGISTAESFNAYAESSEPTVNLRSSIRPNRSEKNLWSVHTDEDGSTYYANPKTSEKWVPAHSSDGQIYYYEALSRKSAWVLPSVNSESSSQSDDTDSNRVTSLNRPSSLRSEIPTFSTIDLSTAKEKFGARAHSPPTKNTFGWFGDKKRQPSDNADLLSSVGFSEDDSGGQYAPNKISTEHITGPIEQKIRNTERRGVANRTKLSENGTTVSKKWIPSFLILSGPVLQIYKDVKNQKVTNQLGRPELEFHMKDLAVDVISDKSITSRENILLLRDTTDEDRISEYLLEFPSAVLLKAWETAFKYSKDFVDENRFAPRAFSSHAPPSVDSRIIIMLQNFFRRRPPIEALRASGIFKDEAVFGASLIELCTRENSKVPNFVVRVIRAIEARGLDADGIFRKSGCGGVIQKLRNEVNHHEYSLNSLEWGVYELSDSLKLFLRELKEPLFCFSIFEHLVHFYQSLNRHSVDENIVRMRKIIQMMPDCHQSTAKSLFSHLTKVAAHHEENKMPSSNLALIIGPNLMWPEGFSSHFSDYAAASFCCTEFIIDHSSALFASETAI